MFSEDGNLAIVNISTISNLVGGTHDGQIYVFKKQGKDWIYFFNFLSGIS